jgi:peptidase E
MEPDNPLLDQYFLKQTGKRIPSICFVPTASGDSDTYIVKFYAAFNKLSCKPCHLSLFRPPENLEAFVLSQDAIYVGGGNTKNLIALWREWRLDKIFRKAWQRGTVLGGISAGSICWFEEGLTDSLPGKLTRLECLGLLKASNCPHYDSEPKLKPAFRRLIASGKLYDGIGADNGVALHFIGRKLAHVVSSRPDAAAYSVRKINGKIHEQRLEARYLGT